MASQRSSSEATTYRDRPPASPRQSFSPSAFPQWLRPTRIRSGLFSHGRLKLGFVAMACVLLGWMVTSTLGPGDDYSRINHHSEAYDMASGGVLGDPSGFGQKVEESDPDEVIAEHAYGEEVSKEPSVSGALADLHHAVADKLQAWNPHHGGPDKTFVNSTGQSRTHKGLPTSSAPADRGEYIADGIPENERLGARTRIGKCTILFNGNSFWERAIKTHEEHDRIHGYRMHVLRQQLLDDVWSKPAYILSLLLRELAKPEGERLDWLFWVDADTIILNPYVPIEVFLPPPGTEFEDVNLLYANDWNGLNNGVFPVKVCQWSVQLFSAIVAFRHYKPDDQLIFRDQSAMDAIMKEPRFVKNVVNAPQRWFNAYQGEHNETLAPFQIRRGDLLVHFAGVGNRDERMGYWLDRAEQHLDDWEVPLKSTSYPKERADFWAEQREQRDNRKSSMAEARLKASNLRSSVEQRLGEYGDRLTEQDRTLMSTAREAMQNVLDDDKYGDDLDMLNEMMTNLESAAAPLTAAKADGQKVLLKTAHEAIFAGERDLLDGGFATGVSTPETQIIDQAINRLKNLVMAPQGEWQRASITAATNALTEARAIYRNSKAALEAQKTKDAAAEDARKAVQAQAQANGEAAGAASAVEAAVPAFSAQVATTDVGVHIVEVGQAITTVMGEPVIHTIIPEPVAITVWQTVAHPGTEATQVADGK